MMAVVNPSCSYSIKGSVFSEAFLVLWRVRPIGRTKLRLLLDGTVAQWSFFSAAFLVGGEGELREAEAAFIIVGRCSMKVEVCLDSILVEVVVMKLMMLVVVVILFNFGQIRNHGVESALGMTF